MELHLDLDLGDEASNLNDDTSLTIGTPYGTIGFFASEGGLSTEYANLSGALGANRDYANVSGADVDFQGYDVDGYANIQYHTPADLLPYGISLKYGYVPNMAQTEKGASAKAVGAENKQILSFIRDAQYKLKHHQSMVYLSQVT